MTTPISVRRKFASDLMDLDVEIVFASDHDAYVRKLEETLEKVLLSVEGKHCAWCDGDGRCEGLTIRRIS